MSINSNESEIRDEDEPNDDDEQNESDERAGSRAQQRRLEEMEAQAVDKAKVTADAAFRPSPSILNAQQPTVLLQQVDGPPLDQYDAKESVYVGRSLRIPAGGDLHVPIHVITPGSVVEYVVELQGMDISFGITAERDEGVTIVKVRCCCRCYCC